MALYKKCYFDLKLIKDPFKQMISLNAERHLIKYNVYKLNLSYYVWFKIFIIVVYNFIDHKIKKMKLF